MRYLIHGCRLISNVVKLSKHFEHEPSVVLNSIPSPHYVSKLSSQKGKESNPSKPSNKENSNFYNNLACEKVIKNQNKTRRSWLGIEKCKRKGALFIATLLRPGTTTWWIYGGSINGQMELAIQMQPEPNRTHQPNSPSRPRRPFQLQIDHFRSQRQVHCLCFFCT